MVRSYFLAVLLISAVLALFISPGMGREGVFFGEVASSFNQVDDAENSERGRMMMATVMDYDGPGANTNPRTGYLLAPPPRPPSKN